MENLELLVDRLVQALSERPSVPLHAQVWDADLCAKYLVVSKKTFLERIAPLPSFPSPARIEDAHERLIRPRWRANEVVAWFQKQPRSK
ncbi:MAG: hypothetical protein RBT51_10510 [Ectothiorhodospiraceae bacterium]|nr:hypothetical protein [Ectothiorhodospiraceae bacterium]